MDIMLLYLFSSVVGTNHLSLFLRVVSDDKWIASKFSCQLLQSNNIEAVLGVLKAEIGTYKKLHPEVGTCAATIFKRLR